MSAAFPKAKPINPTNSGPRSRSPEPRDSGIILGALALPGNPYDGHTFEAALKQIKRMTGNQPKNLIADRGKREWGKTQLLTPSAPLKSDSQ